MSNSMYADTVVSEQDKQSFSAQSLPALLRSVGAATLLISVSIYLFQGWGQGSDLMRYFLLLGHTVGLAVVGMFCSRLLNEQKGARLLLMLTLVFISANFAIIGGFIFSIWGQPVAGIHGAVTWVIANSSSSFLAIGSALVVLTPLTYLGFSVCARRSAKQFSLVFLLSNFILLVPTRDEMLLAGLMLTLLCFVLYVITKARSQDVTLSTKEGLIARLILFVPLGIMLGRNLMHSVGAIMPLMLFIAVFVLMRQVTIGLSSKNFIRKIVEFTSIVPIFGAAGSFATLVSIELNAAFEVSLLAFSVCASAMLFELSARASSGKGFYSVIASTLMSGMFMFNLFEYDSVYSLMACSIGGIVLMGFGYMTERRVAFVLGLIMLIAGVAFYFMDVFQNFDVSAWFGLAAIGVGAIVLGSYIEKNGEKVKSNARELRHSLSAWGY